VREVLLARSEPLRARIAALSTRLVQLSKNFEVVKNCYGYQATP
jgi:hypothetical protein